MRPALVWMAVPFLAAALLNACREPQAPIGPGSGHALYLARCAVCHGQNGEGRPGLYPPLAGSEYINGSPERLAAIVLDGLQGPLDHYNAVMPGWRGYLKDAEIAAIISWLRQKEGKPPVTPVEVARVHIQTEGRNTFWTVADLQHLNIH